MYAYSGETCCVKFTIGHMYSLAVAVVCSNWVQARNNFCCEIGVAIYFENDGAHLYQGDLAQEFHYLAQSPLREQARFEKQKKRVGKRK